MNGSHPDRVAGGIDPTGVGPACPAVTPTSRLRGWGSSTCASVGERRGERRPPPGRRSPTTPLSCRAGDAMGGAGAAGRAHRPRTSPSSAHALNSGLRRPAGPASSSPRPGVFSRRDAPVPALSTRPRRGWLCVPASADGPICERRADPRPGTGPCDLRARASGRRPARLRYATPSKAPTFGPTAPPRGPEREARDGAAFEHDGGRDLERGFAIPRRPDVHRAGRDGHTFARHDVPGAVEGAGTVAGVTANARDSGRAPARSLAGTRLHRISSSTGARAPSRPSRGASASTEARRAPACRMCPASRRESKTRTEPGPGPAPTGVAAAALAYPDRRRNP